MSHAESAESSEKPENPKQFLLTLMTLREISTQSDPEPSSATRYEARHALRNRPGADWHRAVERRWPSPVWALSPRPPPPKNYLGGGGVVWCVRVVAERSRDFAPSFPCHARFAACTADRWPPDRPSPAVRGRDRRSQAPGRGSRAAPAESRRRLLALLLQYVRPTRSPMFTSDLTTRCGFKTK